MELKSKSVKLFCSVVETGSLLAAANKNSLSTSAASRSITQLEDRLGVQLFDRATKTLTLTPEGMEFYRVAMESVRAWRRLEDFGKERLAKKHPLRIAVLARHCSDVIIPAVVKILKRHENTMSVTMDVHASRDIYYSKYSHPFDVGFGTLLSTHDDLQKVPIAHIPFRLVVSEENPLSKKHKVSRSDYASESFVVLSRDTPEREYSDRLLPEHGLEHITAEVSSTQVALRFVKRNVGVHFTDMLAAKSVSADCRALEIEDQLTIPFFVFWPRTNQALPDVIIECIAQIASSIEAAGVSLTEEGNNFLKLADELEETSSNQMRRFAA